MAVLPSPGLTTLTATTTQTVLTFGSTAQGNITSGDVVAVLPFSNTLAIKRMSGASILGSLEWGVSAVGSISGLGKFLQVRQECWCDPRFDKCGRRCVTPGQLLQLPQPVCPELQRPPSPP